MDWRTLFLSADGRIGQKDFWVGVLILFVIWLLAPALHILAPLVWLLLLYPWVCVFAKRLHDFGKSGLLILVPFIVAFVAVMFAGIFGGVTVVSAIWAAAQGGYQPTPWAMLFGALTVALGFLAFAGLVKFIFILWVGLSRGDPGPNRYGPPPSPVTSPTAPTAA
jgi:uncharacterized membrane protein YhaH (DUF805 family)